MEQILSLFTYNVASEVNSGTPGEKSVDFTNLLRRFCTDIKNGSIERHMHRSQLTHNLANSLAGGDTDKLRAMLCRNVAFFEQFSELGPDERRELSVFLEEFRKIARSEEDLARYLFPVDILKGQ